MIFPSYKRLFDLIPYLVDEEFGIINQVISLPRQSDMPDFMYFKAIVANTGVLGFEENFTIGGGTALTRDRALAKALGEGVERYSSAIYNREELLWGKYLDFPSKAIHPQAFTHFPASSFKKKDFPFQPFNEHSFIGWCKAKNIHAGHEELVPAAMVYCPYSPDKSKGEQAIVEIISTGLASHLSYEEAALNGILEVIERDSFMLCWLSATSPPMVEQRSLLPEHQEMLRRFAQFGYQVSLFDIRSDTQVPTFLAIMKGTYKGSVPFAAAAAAHLSPEAAIRKCLEELALIERFAKRMLLNENQILPSDAFSKIVHLSDHIQYWIHDSSISKSEFLYKNNSSISLEDIPTLSTGNPNKDLNTISARINEIGHKILIADTSAPDVSALGFHVIRALIPGFLPLNKRYDCRPLNSKRLKSHMKNHGLHAINPLPHPFA